MSTTDLPVKPAVAPVQQAERIQIVDILRGFALFGILLVNMALFSYPFQSILFPAAPAMPWYDCAATWLIHLLAEGKFYALFSLLFGLGMILLMERIEAAAEVRALLHAAAAGPAVHRSRPRVLIWPGDILIMYALLGFPLLLFRKSRPRTLLIWAAILIAIPLVFMAVATGLVALGSMTPEGAQQIEQSFAANEAGYLADVARGDEVYAGGNFLAITAQRTYDYLSMGLISLFVLGFNILAMFLVGVWFGKRRIFNDLDAHRPFFRKLLAWGLIVGLAGNAIYATLIMGIPRYDASVELLIATIAARASVRRCSCWPMSRRLPAGAASGLGSAAAGAGAGGADGADQLSAGVAHLHAHLLRLRSRPVRPGRRGVGHRPDRRDLPAADSVQPLVDETLPLRPGRVAVAVDDLLAAAADEAILISKHFGFTVIKEIVLPSLTFPCGK